MKIEGYCLKCRESMELESSEMVTMKNGRLAAKGRCQVCGTQIYKILSRECEAKLLAEKKTDD